ncbi:MAG: hypothetical protein ACK2T7_14960 [Anaerolineales bacterium]
MLLLIPVLILLAGSVLISLLGLSRPRFNYHWLITTASALAAWIVTWLLVSRLPVEIGPLEGGYQGLSLPSLSFRADQISWPMAMAISTLLLAVLLTDVGRAAESSWLVWAGDLGLTAVGMAAVLAGNPSTMVLAWTVVDLIELGIMLRQLKEENMRRRAAVFFATNLLGTIVVFAALIAAGGAGVRMNLTSIPEQAVIYLILAVGLRIGVFPLQVTFLRDVHHQRGQGTLLRLIPPAVSLALLAHSATTPITAGWRTVLLIFAALAAVYGAIVWMRVTDELRGRLFWIIGLGGMAFAAAAQAQQGAVLAWGLAIIYPGALLFLSSARTKVFLPLGILGLLTISAIPFSPTYAGLRLYQPFHILLILLPLAHVLLIGGYLRHMLQQTEPLSGVEPWVQASYVLGLALLPVTHIASSILGPKIAAEGQVPIWPLLVDLVLILLGVVAYWRKWTIPAELFDRLDKVFSLRWVFTLIRWVDTAMRRTAELVTQLLEEDGGVLWALVILVILASVLGQFTTTGGTP